MSCYFQNEPDIPCPEEEILLMPYNPVDPGESAGVD